jgi:hypothetical protein
VSDETKDDDDDDDDDHDDEQNCQLKKLTVAKN